MTKNVYLILYRKWEKNSCIEILKSNVETERNRSYVKLRICRKIKREGERTNNENTRW